MGIRYWLSFASGFAVMTFELALSRMAAPFFGTSLPVWAAIISSVLGAMAAGYALGGRLSLSEDPARWIAVMLIAAGILMAAMSLGFPILLDFASDVRSHGAALRITVLATAGLGAMLPVAAFGAVVPLLVRTAVTVVEESGSAAGRLSATATAGSLLGTLLPAFLLFPLFGVRTTVIGVGVILSASGILLRRRFIVPVSGVLAALVGLGATVHFDPGDRFRGYRVIHQEESLHHARIAVLEAPSGERELRVNAAWSVQSTYHPRGPSWHGSWPRFLTAALLRNACDRPPGRVLIIGLAAGTMARDLAFAYPDATVEGVETDLRLVDLGRRYFELPENTRVTIVDGRRFLRETTQTFDLIFIDAFDDIYLPDHLATDAFFSLARRRLEADGALAINVLFHEKADGLTRGIANTLASAFERVAWLRPGALMNAVLFAWNGTRLDAMDPSRCIMPAHHIQKLRTERFFSLLEVLTPTSYPSVFTDDRVPVAHLTHLIAWHTLLGGRH